MCKNVAFFALFLAAAVVCLGTATSGYAFDIETDNIPLKIVAGADRMIYPVDQKVSITVYIKNTGEDTVEIVEPAIDKRSFFFEISLPDGKKDKLLDIYGLNLQKIKLPPKKRIKFTASFTPETAGRYRIDVRYFGYKDVTVEAEPLFVHVVNPPLRR